MPFLIPLLVIGGLGITAWSANSAATAAGTAAGTGISDAAIVVGLAVAVSIVAYTLKQPGQVKL